MPLLSAITLLGVMIVRSLRFVCSSTRQTCLIFVICFASAVSGCSIVGSDPEPESAERTLPEALDARRVSLEDATRTVAPPDTVNVAAYVVGYIICPENVKCLLPDGIKVAEKLELERDEDARYIAVNRPRQFQKGGRYLISLNVTASSNRNFAGNRLEIIGYSNVE